MMQLSVLTILVCVAYLWQSQKGAISMLLGGLCYIIPTALSFWVLAWLKPYPALAGKVMIFASGLKTVLSLILLLLCFKFYTPLHFISFFMGLLAVSHLVFLFFLKVSRYDSCSRRSN